MAGRSGEREDDGDGGSVGADKDVRVLSEVILQLQTSIDSMVAVRGPVRIRSLMLPSTAASDLRPQQIIQQLSNPFASDQHKGRSNTQRKMRWLWGRNVTALRQLVNFVLA